MAGRFSCPGTSADAVDLPVIGMTSRSMATAQQCEEAPSSVSVQCHNVADILRELCYRPYARLSALRPRNGCSSCVLH